MDCQQASLLMMEFLDGMISEIDSLELQDHIDRCNSCSQEFSLLLESISLVDDMEEIEPPEELESLVMSKINVHQYKKESKVIAWMLRTIVIVGLILGALTYLAFNNPVILEKTIIATVVKVVNFTVLILPRILGRIEENFVLIIGIGLGILFTLLISIFMLVTAEYYIVEKLKFKFKGGVKS